MQNRPFLCLRSDPGSQFLVCEYHKILFLLLLTRDRDGQVHAFVNSCRHRGARVCQEVARRRAQVGVPLSPVDLQLDGRLFAARQMGPDFDTSQFSSAADSLRDASRATSSSVWPRSRRLQATRRQTEAYLPAAPPERSAGRVRVDDRRERQLEAGVGKQSRVLSLRPQSSGAERHLP